MLVKKRNPSCGGVMDAGSCWIELCFLCFYCVCCIFFGCWFVDVCFLRLVLDGKMVHFLECSCDTPSVSLSLLYGCVVLGLIFCMLLSSG